LMTKSRIWKESNIYSHAHCHKHLAESSKTRQIPNEITETNLKQI
jgi:hypothetical protein